MDAKQEPKDWIRISKLHLYVDGVSRHTVLNWTTKGVVSKATGKRVYLKTRQRGGAVETTMDNYKKFVEELNGDWNG